MFDKRRSRVAMLFPVFFRLEKQPLIILRKCGRNFRNKRRDGPSFRISDSGMKSNALLVTNIENGLSTVVAEAARQTGRGLKEANSTRRTFEILKLDLDDVDIAVVEVDAGLHSLAILEALSYGPAAPPVIALIDVDETEATHIVQQHGAAACLKKPFGSEELARLIDKIYAFACQNNSLTCDKWGHVFGRKLGRSQPGLTSIPS